jgi:hypothetical protein
LTMRIRFASARQTFMDAFSAGEIGGSPVHIIIRGLWLNW